MTVLRCHCACTVRCALCAYSLQGLVTNGRIGSEPTELIDPGGSNAGQTDSEGSHHPQRNPPCSQRQQYNSLRGHLDPGLRPRQLVTLPNTCKVLGYSCTIHIFLCSALDNHHNPHSHLQWPSSFSLSLPYTYSTVLYSLINMSPLGSLAF
ncbi:hypothetical protein O181_097988 [Austropuccinia psidii MF-1]|uniref:Uncharacterized protein n=1 Tax=Austropuccinia psidii MF-1 TaxID=1389203 RepID=A0A9Q3PDP9_9BASI|nr:hypothetical protein [Austropuccinia psidii MF-1]